MATLGPTYTPNEGPQDQGRLEDKPIHDCRSDSFTSYHHPFHAQFPTLYSSSLNDFAVKTNNCADQGHQPRLICRTSKPFVIAEVGGLEVTAKLPKISWLPTSLSMGHPQAQNHHSHHSNTTPEFGNSRTSDFATCDSCGQTLSGFMSDISVPRRRAQTQLIPYTPWTSAGAREKKSLTT